MFLHSMMGSGTFSTAAELQALFTGLELIPPGLTILRIGPATERLWAEPGEGDHVIGGSGLPVEAAAPPVVRRVTGRAAVATGHIA